MGRSRSRHSRLTPIAKNKMVGSAFRPLLSGSSYPKLAAAATVFVVATAAAASSDNNSSTSSGPNDERYAQCAAWFWPVQGVPTLPRPLRHRDPLWTLTRSQLRQRARDERKLKTIVAEIHQRVQSHQQSPQRTLDDKDEQLEQFRSGIAKLQTQWLDTAYGPGVTLADRRQFLERYGCTGFTDPVLDCILDQHQPAGIVEIGAGNGQWARALTERCGAHHQEQQKSSSNQKSSSSSYQVVLAYDDMSQLPLSPKVYHEKTKVAHHHFGTVRPLLSGGGGNAKPTDETKASADALRFTLQQWQCRGRALLLVYPPPASDMAVQSVRVYDQLAQDDHTIIYVGEGRGGSTANDAFFDYLESSGQWWIMQVLDVKSFGTKGYEKLYVLKKTKPSIQQSGTE
jgi:hypothetical protein